MGRQNGRPIPEVADDLRRGLRLASPRLLPLATEEEAEAVEFEHATIVDRVTAGIERRAEEGRWATGRLPFGYRRDEQKQVVPDEREAAVVRGIVELYASGRLGTAAIARTLVDEQAPSPPRGWQPAVVQWLLENDTYLGRCTGAATAIPVCTSRSSTSSRSLARTGCCASAATTAPSDRATRATSYSPAWCAAGAAAAPMSA